MPLPQLSTSRRALTLMEILLSLAILSAMMLAALGWMRTAGTITTDVSRTLRWETSANAALQVIHDDLTVGDFELTRPGQNDAQAGRVRIESNDLIIETRAKGKPVSQRYNLDRETQRIRRSGNSDRVLLIDVTDFECELNEDDGTLTVSIESHDRTAMRTFTLP